MERIVGRRRRFAMTEAEWLACEDPEPMLAFLRGKASDRKLRLFSIACCRRVWDWLGEESQRALDVMERYLDGNATAAEHRQAAKGAQQDWIDEFGTHYPSTAAFCATDLGMSAHDAAVGTATAIADAVGLESARNRWVPTPTRWMAPTRWKVVHEEIQRAGQAGWWAERAWQSHLLRDIFHGPCRPVYVRSRWRNPVTRQMALGIYAGRDFTRMIDLATALAAAGCEDRTVLDHLRSPGPHARGCWAVDLVLGKA
jgi:hypothetical protein